MTTRTLDTGAALADLRDAWSDLHARTGAPVFMAPEWLLPWWSVYRSSIAVRALSCWDGDRLIGLFPCFLGALGPQPARMVRLRMMGEQSVLGEYSPLVDPEFHRPALNAAGAWIAEILKRGDGDLLDFHQFRGTDTNVLGLAQAMLAQGLSVRFSSENLARVSFPAPADWEEYRKRLSYNERAFLGRRERLLAREGAEVEKVTTADDPSAISDFISLHTTAWSDRGEKGFFRGRKGFEAFQREALPVLLSRGFARLYFFTRDGVRFASLLTFLLHKRLTLYLSGRDPWHELARHSPGRVLMSLVIRDGIEEGVEDIDLMQGTTDYKFRIGGKLAWYGRLTATCPGLKGLRGLIASRALFMRDGLRALKVRRVQKKRTSPSGVPTPER